MFPTLEIRFVHPLTPEMVTIGELANPYAVVGGELRVGQREGGDKPLSVWCLGNDRETVYAYDVLPEWIVGVCEVLVG